MAGVSGAGGGVGVGSIPANVALLPGRPGGQTLRGGVQAGETLTLQSNPSPTHENDPIVLKDSLRLVPASAPSGKGALTLNNQASRSGQGNGVRLFSDAAETNWFGIYYLLDGLNDTFIMAADASAGAVKPVGISGTVVSLQVLGVTIFDVGGTGFIPGVDATADGVTGKDIGQSDKRVRNVFQRGYTEMSVLSADPPAPPAGRARLYMVTVAGKVQYRVRWPSGVVTTLATEP